MWFGGCCRFLLVRKTVQQVSERFGVHMPVLDRHLEQPGIEIIEVRIDPRACIGDVSPYFCLGRPISGGVRGRSAGRGIDSAFEQLVELWMKGRRVHTAAREQIPVERFEVPEIKNQPVAFGDGPLVESRRRDDVEEVVRLLSGVCEFSAESL